jgi:hypothetical protein
MAKKILKGAANLATFGLAGSVIKSMFGKKKPAATPAPEQKPTVMPLADDEAVRQAKRKSIIQQRSRRGRESTILTGDTLGGS